jgi:cell division protein FtsB
VLIEGGAARTRLGRVPFVLVLMAVFGLGMAGLLALNTTLQGQAFQARSLHDKANQLTYQQAALERQVDDLRSVDKLAARAFAMGLRPDPDPAFVRLPDGKVIGEPTPVTGNEVPGLVKTPEQIKAQRQARQAKRKAAEAKQQADQARREAEQQRSGNDGTGQQGTTQQGTTQQGTTQQGTTQQGNTGQSDAQQGQNQQTGNQGGQG